MALIPSLSPTIATWPQASKPKPTSRCECSHASVMLGVDLILGIPYMLVDLILGIDAILTFVSGVSPIGMSIPAFLVGMKAGFSYARWRSRRTRASVASQASLIRYDQFNVDGLRAECRACGLRSTGHRDELLARLNDNGAFEDDLPPP